MIGYHQILEDMKKYILILTGVFCLFAIPAFAKTNTLRLGAPQAIKKSGNLGVGVGAGTLATGLSLKYFLSDDTSVQGNLGFSRGCVGCGRRGGRYYNESVAASVDFLLERGPIAGDEKLSLDWEIGAGAGLGLTDSTITVAAAGVIGLQLNIHALPIDIVVEFRPGAVVVPEVYLNLVDFTGHVRYYF